jgi:hypothetical protein
VVQQYFTYSLFRQFQVYSTAHRAFVESGVEDRSARAFPIGSAVFGVVGLLGLFVALASVAGHTLEASSAAEMFLGLTMDAAILGVALGMGSVLSGYRPRTLAMVGLASSGLAIAIWLTTILL